jgi:hypothetical protein
MTARFAIAAICLALCSCSGSSPGPLQPSAAHDSGSAADPSSDVQRSPAACLPIGFDGLRAQNAVFSTYSTCGFTVAATTPNWTVSTTYGHPAPFIQFNSAAGTTSSGEIVVNAGGVNFKFQSVDLYSSTTRIPYEITGFLKSAAVLTMGGTLGNTFGNFVTVSNPKAATFVDALRIRLTNAAAPCCPNPMGLDSIVVAY